MAILLNMTAVHRIKLYTRTLRDILNCNTYICTPIRWAQFCACTMGRAARQRIAQSCDPKQRTQLYTNTMMTSVPLYNQRDYISSQPRRQPCNCTRWVQIDTCKSCTSVILRIEWDCTPVLWTRLRICTTGPIIHTQIVWHPHLQVSRLYTCFVVLPLAEDILELILRDASIALNQDDIAGINPLPFLYKLMLHVLVSIVLKQDDITGIYQMAFLYTLE